MTTTHILDRLRAVAITACLIAGLAPAAIPGAVAAAVLGPPTLVTPASGATVTGNPVFAWTAVSSAVKYRIEVSDNPGFSPTVIADETQNLRYAPTTELPLGTLYWRVAARDASNALGTYASDNFTKEWGAAPNPLTPDDGATLSFPTDPLLFTWSALSGAQSYELQVDDATDFIGASSYTTKNTAFVITEPRTVGQAFYWRLRGVSGGINSEWSPIRELSTDWPAAPALQHPADGSTTTDVYFDWDPVPGAKTYQLQVSPNADWANNKTIDVTVKSTRYAPPNTINNGNYFWRVRGLDAASTANFGPWSEVRVFQRDWPDRPELVYPANGAVIDFPTWTWTPAERASWYRVNFSQDVNFGSGVSGCVTNRTTWTPYVSATGVALVNPSNTCSFAPTPGATYYWRVQALDAPVLNAGVDIYTPTPLRTNGVLGLWSATRSFVYQTPAPSAPDPGYPGYIEASDYLSPARCVPATCTAYEADTPVFTWTAVPGASQYTIYVALDPNFTNIYRTYVTAHNRLAPRDSWRDNQANQAYYWFVRPKVDANTGVFDETVFPLAGVFQKRSEGIHRVTPLQGSILPDDFTFSWDDFLATNADLAPPVDQEALRYRITVSTVGDFATTIDEKVVDQPFFTPFDRTYPEGPIYWRVQAIDGSDNDLTVSTTGGELVNKQSPVPSLTYPDNGATATGVPYLQWSPLDYAASYDVQIDNESNFSSPITTTTTKMTAWAYTEPLASGTYYWRVRRNDADNRDGAGRQSAPSILAPAAPTLVSPANGANPSPVNLVLQWTSSTAGPQVHRRAEHLGNVHWPGEWLPGHDRHVQLGAEDAARKRHLLLARQGPERVGDRRRDLVHLQLHGRLQPAERHGAQPGSGRVDHERVHGHVLRTRDRRERLDVRRHGGRLVDRTPRHRVDLVADAGALHAGLPPCAGADVCDRPQQRHHGHDRQPAAPVCRKRPHLDHRPAGLPGRL